MNHRLISNDLLRALRYLQLVNDAGAGVSGTHLDAWLNVTPPVELSRLDSTIRQFELLIGRDYGYAEYIDMVGWAQGEPMHLTPAGRAIVKAHEGVDETDGQGLVILSPQDPLNLVTLTGTIAQAKAGLLVDPYFTDDLFPWLIESTSIARVLLCRDPGKRSSLPLLAGAAVASGRNLSVRCLPARALHDRFLVAEGGAVSTIGASLNGMSRHFTTITRLPEAGEAPVRDFVEEKWRKAQPVEPRTDIRTKTDSRDQG